MLNSKQRAFLRSMSNNMETVFQIGKGGITDELTLQVSNCLEARELMKIRVLESSGYSSKEAAQELAQAVAADVVSVVGMRFVLYRESQNKKKIELP